MYHLMYSPLKTNIYAPICIFLFVCTTATTSIAFNVTTLTFEESYSPLFSTFNIKRSPNDKTVNLLLNRFSGSGIISSDYYNYGFFSASIKMPSEHTAGIVVAFYTSNVDTFERNHDELDIEFLGNTKGKPWRFQTNMYGNGSVSRGREERYRMWFDPTIDSHRYSILWTPRNIIFYVDEIPIREVIRNKEMKGDYPSKPMSVYATIWDASSWATNGGQEKVDYKYQPFIAEFTDLVLEGCIVDPTDQLLSSNCTDSISALIGKEYSTITSDGRKSMKWFREKYMYYSYCYDNLRYPIPPPECIILPSERDLFKDSGRLRERMKFHGGIHHRRRHGRNGRNSRRRSKGVAVV
ncbi:PREDICTED: probable xyloglucan endotransglucosylase/hydrolase protein 30 [Erythranthe guttata]|nr:PREDICTED: probable xyloglucan endotransglucosylase/hydrolase protein 30 [Erythranthe guttata]|eukprot:XP_012829812.1 PREDICTED: probable xyloglucan endotransglucosylase/hydrolase protein 30 [Erythranthe guttata]